MVKYKGEVITIVWLQFRHKELVDKGAEKLLLWLNDYARSQRDSTSLVVETDEASDENGFLTDYKIYLINFNFKWIGLYEGLKKEFPILMDHMTISCEVEDDGDYDYDYNDDDEDDEIKYQMLHHFDPRVETIEITPPSSAKNDK